MHYILASNNHYNDDGEYIWWNIKLQYYFFAIFFFSVLITTFDYPLHVTNKKNALFYVQITLILRNYIVI